MFPESSVESYDLYYKLTKEKYKKKFTMDILMSKTMRRHDKNTTLSQSTVSSITMSGSYQRP